jgi:2,3-dihydroxybenzoate-AMP ligase
LDARQSSAADLSSLCLVQVGGAKLLPEAARRVRPELGCRLQQVFGMAEGLVNYTGLDDPEELIVSTQGRPISEHDELRIVDPAGQPVRPGEVGSLETRGPYTIRGYYGDADPAAFSADGFYRSGDLVRQLASGHLVVEGRVKDQINRGGEKIAPDEVENHLIAHPGVLDAALIALPDPRLGERSCAVVMPHPDQVATAPELRRFLRERGLAAFKIPDRFEFTGDFPQTGVGKLSRRQMRERLTARIESETLP